MAGLTDAIGTAQRGLQVVQRRIGTTGHNIANATTEGFSRQRAVLQASAPNVDGTGAIGTGVEQVSVVRIVDEFAQLRLLSETSRFAGLETRASIYGGVESILNDQLSGGLTDDLSGFFDALDDLSNASEPGQPVERGALLASAESLVDTVHRFDERLRELQSGADRGITSLIPEVNGLARRIADLNGRIAEAETRAPANDLRDQRDRLLLELAGQMEFSTLESDSGMISVRFGGVALVDGRTANELRAVVDPGSPNAFDPRFAQVFFQGSGSSFDVTDSIRGGELGGLIAARDDIVGGVIRDLDAFAFTLAENFNAEHRNGLGLVDGAPHDFFADLSGQPNVNDSARNLRISSDVDPAQGGTLDHIATGSVPNPVTGGPEAAPGDLSHVERLKDLRRGTVPIYLAGDATGAPTGSTRSISASLTQLIGDVGQQVRSTERSLEQQQAVLQSAQDRRDSVSGVSVDEEVAGLVLLQTSFQANARVISTVNRLFDDLLAAF